MFKALLYVMAGFVFRAPVVETSLFVMACFVLRNI